MSTSIGLEIHQPAKLRRPAAPAREASTGEPERRIARDRSETMTVEVRGRASPIRAWRAVEEDSSRTAEQADGAGAKVATALRHRPFRREAGDGLRQSVMERAARMRAIEQAWKEEQARQAELDADEQRRAERATG